MGQPKPEDQSKLEKILKLIDELSPPEQNQLLERLQSYWFRRESRGGADHSGGEVIDGFEVLSRLRDKSEDEQRKSQE